ncbi:Uncharacterised protein [uncultured archaeon]|nr:Uncharacterised protein [uncultured archaeon]
MTQRYKICGDNSGHEYYIKTQDVEKFYEWVESTEDEDKAEMYTGPDFDEFRIDGNFTFTDPRID